MSKSTRQTRPDPKLQDDWDSSVCLSSIVCFGLAAAAGQIRIFPPPLPPSILPSILPSFSLLLLFLSGQQKLNLQTQKRRFKQMLVADRWNSSDSLTPGNMSGRYTTLLCLFLNCCFITAHTHKVTQIHAHSGDQLNL